MNRILLAVDLEDGKYTVERARPWVERAGLATDLLYVAVEAPSPPQLANAEAALESLLRLLPEPLRGTATVAKSPRVAEEIVQRSEGYSLLVVGTHGRRGLAHAWLGSVAERVVRTSSIPVLIPHGSGPTGPVLVAVEPSHQPEVLFAEARAWAERLGSRVDALHVRLIPHLPKPGESLMRETWAADNRAAEEQLQTWMEALPEACRGGSTVAIGEAGDEVVRAAAAHALVVVGTHGRTGPDRFWLGSVAERVVRRSPVPVLIVPLRGV